MPTFYGLYVADEKLAAALDLVRFLAEPWFFRRAHITVRGPYTDRVDEQIQSIAGGNTYQIHVLGIDSFIQPLAKQNTVFLKCHVPEIEKIWHKPDYTGEITPHITLFDGPDRGIAYSVLHLCQKFRWNFSTWSTELVKIKSKVPSGALDEFEVHQNLYDIILGRRLDYRKLQHQQWMRRRPYLEEVVRFIETNYVPTSTRTQMTRA